MLEPLRRPSRVNANEGGTPKFSARPLFAIELAAYGGVLPARGEGYASQHLAETGSPQRSKTLSAWGSRATCVQLVRDHDQFIRIGTLITVPADRRSDGINRCRPVAIHDSCDIAEPGGCRRPGESRAASARIIPRRITRNDVRYSEIYS